MPRLDTELYIYVKYVGIFCEQGAGVLVPHMSLVLGEISKMNTGKLCIRCSLIIFRICCCFSALDFHLFRLQEMMRGVTKRKEASVDGLCIFKILFCVFLMPILSVVCKVFKVDWVRVFVKAILKDSWFKSSFCVYLCTFACVYGCGHSEHPRRVKKCSLTDSLFMIMGFGGLCY